MQSQLQRKGSGAHLNWNQKFQGTAFDEINDLGVEFYEINPFFFLSRHCGNAS